MRAVSLVALVMLALGCASEEKAAYQRLAVQVNPIFVTLLLKVAAIKAMGPGAYDTDARLAAACAGADDELGRLSGVDFGRESSIYSGLRDLPSHEASNLIQHRDAMCGWPAMGTPTTSYKPVNGTGRVLRNCRGWCLERWSHFTEVASDFTAAARAEGVDVIELPHVDLP